VAAAARRAAVGFVYLAQVRHEVIDDAGHPGDRRGNDIGDRGALVVQRVSTNRRGSLLPQEVAALVSLIATINAWNAISVSTRAWVPGSYEP
jgi:hypothetical protein